MKKIITFLLFCLIRYEISYKGFCIGKIIKKPSEHPPVCLLNYLFYIMVKHKEINIMICGRRGEGARPITIDPKEWSFPKERTGWNENPSCSGRMFVGSPKAMVQRLKKVSEPEYLFRTQVHSIDACMSWWKRNDLNPTGAIVKQFGKRLQHFSSIPDLCHS